MWFKMIRNLFFITMGFILMTSCGRQEGLGGSSQEKRTEMIEERPIYLYKVVSVDDWAKSCKTVHLSSMDADFIHLSTEEQLDKIIEKYWAGASEYVVLKIEVAKLPGNLVFEANPGGTNKCYHLYKGSIPLTAIIEMQVRKK